MSASFPKGTNIHVATELVPDWPWWGLKLSIADRSSRVFQMYGVLDATLSIIISDNSNFNAEYEGLYLLLTAEDAMDFRDCCTVQTGANLKPPAPAYCREGLTSKHSMIINIHFIAIIATNSMLISSMRTRRMLCLLVVSSSIVPRHRH